MIRSSFSFLSFSCVMSNTCISLRNIWRTINLSFTESLHREKERKKNFALNFSFSSFQRIKECYFISKHSLRKTRTNLLLITMAQVNELQSACKICLAPASNSHYGIRSCEPCKIFFRRNATKERVCFSYWTRFSFPN